MPKPKSFLGIFTETGPLITLAMIAQSAGTRRLAGPCYAALSMKYLQR